jgi:hypothetical protein
VSDITFFDRAKVSPTTQSPRFLHKVHCNSAEHAASSKMQHQSSSAPVSPSTRPGVSIKGFACSSSGDDVSPQSQGSSAQRANSTTVSLLSLLLASSATNFAHQSSAQLADEDSYEDSEGEDEQDLETCADGVMPPPNNSSGSSTSPCVAPHLLRRSCSAPVPIPVNTL